MPGLGVIVRLEQRAVFHLACSSLQIPKVLGKTRSRTVPGMMVDLLSSVQYYQIGSKAGNLVAISQTITLRTELMRAHLWYHSEWFRAPMTI